MDSQVTENTECPICGGDCAGANPPMLNCPTELLEEIKKLTEQVESLKAIRRSQNVGIERLREQVRNLEADAKYMREALEQAEDRLSQIVEGKQAVSCEAALSLVRAALGIVDESHLAF